jgi:chemotaxis family two-component system sensor kinase Cph1
MTFDPEKFNFEKCEEEKITIPESIQNFGVLFAIQPSTGEIRRVSANGVDVMSAGQGLIGANFFELIDDSVATKDEILDAYAKAMEAETRLPIDLRFKDSAVKEKQPDQSFSIVYGSGDLMVIEVEPSFKFSGKIAARQQSKIFATKVAPKFRKMRSLINLADEIAKFMRSYTGFERVLIYRFNEDMSGTVIAESKIDGVESYLNLFYPPNDIPAQARELYKINWMRITADAKSEPIPILSADGEAHKGPLDLTHSLLRSMSPIHLEYIRRQGLRSSMSLSLISQDELWGLILFHHRDDYYLPQDLRLECESLAQIFSWQLYAKEEEILHHKRVKADDTIENMISKISKMKNIGDIFKENEDDILELMDASGFLFSYGQMSVEIGEVPRSDLSTQLIASSGKGQKVITLTDMSEKYPELFASGVGGALIVPLLAEKNYHTVWFRKPHEVERRWVGSPHEKGPNASKKERFTPRDKISLHREVITDKAKEWTEEDVRIAESFNKVFLQHALKSQVLMQKNIDQLRAQDKSKNEFLATLAHELRNPLAPISTAIEIINDSGSQELHTEASKTIERQLNQLVTLTDDLMDVSRITRGRVILKKEPTSLRKILANSVEISKKIIDSKKHQLNANYPPESVFVDGDFIRLSQVFSNILNNAAKYTPIGGKIELDFTSTTDQAIICISDNGMGIDNDYLPSIFDMFSQADPFSHKGIGGLGIGLTLCKNLVDLHNGQIEVDSDGLDKGSRFTVRIPLAEQSKLGQKKTANPAEAKKTSSDGKPRVLVVDDNVDSARMLQLLIKAKGYEVRAVNSGLEAVEEFKTFLPEAVFLDIGLPDLDGYEVCMALRKIQRDEKILIVAQTGWGQEEHLKKSADSGFDLHLVKPVKPAQIFEILTKHFAAKKS